MFVCAHCGEVSAAGSFRRAANTKAWAIGKQMGNGFHIRRIVWGLLMANAEKRIDEEIRAAVVMIEGTHKKRSNPLRDLPQPEEPPL